MIVYESVIMSTAGKVTAYHHCVWTYEYAFACRMATILYTLYTDVCCTISRDAKRGVREIHVGFYPVATESLFKYPVPAVSSMQPVIFDREMFPSNLI